MKLSINKHKNKGFTIVELIIVIALIAILAATKWHHYVMKLSDCIF